MLVTRTFSVRENKNGEAVECSSCPLFMFCIKYVNIQTGEINNNLVNNITDYSTKDFVQENISKASICRKSYPKYRIVETTPKEIHRLVGRGGQTIVESDSWLGMIGQTFLSGIIGIVALIIIIGIIFGIASLFG